MEENDSEWECERESMPRKWMGRDCVWGVISRKKKLKANRYLLIAMCIILY